MLESYAHVYDYVIQLTAFLCFVYCLLALCYPDLVHCKLLKYAHCIFRKSLAMYARDLI